jgi:hypothetical protein
MTDTQNREGQTPRRDHAPIVSEQPKKAPMNEADRGQTSAENQEDPPGTDQTPNDRLPPQHPNAVPQPANKPQN